MEDVSPFVQIVKVSELRKINEINVFNYKNESPFINEYSCIKRCSVCDRTGHNKSNCIVMANAYRMMKLQHLSAEKRKLPLMFFIKKDSI
jgi:hypothetical protein